MSIAQPPAATPALPDRSTLLMLFGAFQIALGCLCGLMVLMMVCVFAMMPMPGMPQGEAMNVRMMIPGIAVYVVAAVAFIWLGIGSILARRWAWTLTVVLSWMWLIFGAAGFVVFLLFAGRMMSASIEQQQVKAPATMFAIIQIITGAVMACVYILLPGVFVIFYHRESVRATCQRRDPQIRWTDRCPMPVLALTILMASSVLSMPAMMLYGSAMPLFGGFVSGPAGAAVVLLITLAMAYFAWGSYRLQMAAWWGMLLFCILWSLSVAFTFSRMGLMEMYEKMGMPAAQLELMRKSGVIDTMSRWMPWICLASGAVWLDYLLYVRRYFVRAAGAGKRG